MPQACAPRRLGVALDHDLTKTPAPVYLTLQKNESRQHRADMRDYNNMVLSQNIPNNVLDDKYWNGNGFAGHVQYVPYLGRESLRPGVKFERDIQVATMPNENGKALNVSQMARSAGMVQSTRALLAEEHVAHEKAIGSVRGLRAVAGRHHREEDGHNHHRKEVALNDERHQRIAEVAKVLPGLRSAGLASINPRLGTCGSLPNLNQLTGREGIKTWRTCTPWALNED
eukprot:TRINITY_DN16528_c0_g1_i3.p1 TRINITY_DN16528_c0_g1~~TRINITY_DN16528_c0_g1_i3.p1  ORF type:complete len:228 (-),score=41.00 TRINITY_DN16528_c0_g1_i3:215-898(-)